MQHALSFDMAPYLFGFKGPAQCIEFEQKPMKVHMVPRSGGAPQVSLSLSSFTCTLSALLTEPEGCHGYCHTHRFCRCESQHMAALALLTCKWVMRLVLRCHLWQYWAHPHPHQVLLLGEQPPMQ